jgi:hypothetical protein
MRKRSILLRCLVLAAAIALWSAAWLLVGAPSAEPAQDGLIAPLLPQQGGQSACYVGTFTGQAMDVEDWSRTRLEPTRHLSPDGKPYMRPVPPVLKDRTVASFTLQLTRDGRQSDYAWIYDFRLSAEVDGLGSLYGAGECPWFTGDKKDGPAASTVSLTCGIDCDGGMFGLERVAGAAALTMSFDPRIGLRMKGGCGGEGSYRIVPTASGTVFRLQPAGAEACRALEARAAR